MSMRGIDTCICKKLNYKLANTKKDRNGEITEFNKKFKSEFVGECG